MRHILVTNDDGVQSPGLLALVQEIRQLGKVSIVAPDRNWSASGHVKTMDRPMRVQTVQLADGTLAYATDGAPSDCVALAALGLIERFDLVVSGINPRENVGYDVTYSGTVTAAMEAVITAKVPGIAVSLEAAEDDGPTDFGPAARLARRVVAQVLERGLPEGILLNVNVPHLPESQWRGIMVTRQGQRLYRDSLERRMDPFGRPYYWIGGEPPSGVLEDGTDFGALKKGYVSVTPLHLDLTAYAIVDELREWEWPN